MFVTYQVMTQAWGQDPSTLYFASFDDLLLWTPMIARARPRVQAAILHRSGNLMPLSANEYGRFRDVATAAGAEVGG